MSFKEGDIVEATQDIGIVHLVPKGTVGIVTRRVLPGNVCTVEFFRPDGYVGRTVWVLGGEIKKCDPAKKTSFVTKEEFVDNANRVYAALSKLSNRVLALEEQKKEGEILEDSKPLFKVGDVVKLKDRILLSCGQFIWEGQKINITGIGHPGPYYRASALVFDQEWKFIGSRAFTFYEYQLEATTDYLQTEEKEQYASDIRIAIEKIQKVYRDLINEADHYYHTNKQQEWQQKTTTLLEALSSIKVAFKAKS